MKNLNNFNGFGEEACGKGNATSRKTFPSQAYLHPLGADDPHNRMRANPQRTLWIFHKKMLTCDKGLNQ